MWRVVCLGLDVKSLFLLRKIREMMQNEGRRDAPGNMVGLDVRM